MIDYATYRDKVHGGWLGKCAGGVVGAPLEGFKRFHEVVLTDEMFATAVPNDDLDLQVLWLDLVKQRGPSLRETDLGDHWNRHVRFPWGEYGLATRNLRLGVYPPQSGDHNNWYWKRGMGSPIRSELWGMLCPGLPERAAFYAAMDSSLDHEGFSVDAEAYLAACEALAFVESDVRRILEQGLKLFPSDGLLHTMVTSVLDWSERFDMEVARGKIKSAFGDADFTSSPMNVAFTLLTLLCAEKDLGSLTAALAMGHDSDCVAATSGAMLGILLGYEGVGKRWQELVGDKLVVSPLIEGIETADTVSGLTCETVEAGLGFLSGLGEALPTGAPEPGRAFPSPRRQHVVTRAGDVDVKVLARGSTVTATCQNLTDAPQKLHLSFTSEQFDCEAGSADLELAPGESKEHTFAIRLSADVAGRLEAGTEARLGPAFRYGITVEVDGEVVERLERGIPFYGSWLLLGPFIREDAPLAPVDERYPDHGDSPLPSVPYMNHDRFDPDEPLLELDTVRRLVDEGTYEAQPYHSARVFPSAFRFDLARHYHGRGERTVFLYTRLQSEAARRIWFVMGCSAPFRAWLNGAEVLSRNTSRRSWPAAHPAEVELKAGSNDVLVRIDLPTDHVDLEIGFKEHAGQHSHQSHWDTILVPMV